MTVFELSPVSLKLMTSLKKHKGNKMMLITLLFLQDWFLIV